MTFKNLTIFALAAALSFLAYRSGAVAPGNACLASILPSFAPRSGQTVANSTGDLKTAPAWELKNLEGRPVKLADYKGKVVLLTFWATWCPPCRAEIPDLIAMQNQYKEQGLVVVGISVDQADVKTVQAFVTRNKINYPIVMGDEKTIEAYGNVEVVPTTFYIDREGNIAGNHIGGADKATFEEAVKPLLERPTARL